MRILHVSASDHHGGAAIAAVRLHQALKQFDINSQMLVQDKTLDDPSIKGDQTPWEKLLSRGRRYVEKLLLKLQGTPNSFHHSLNIFPSGRTKSINKCNTDIIHLHWVNDEMISIGELGRIENPTIWTLHDSWPFCGAEHHQSMEGIDRHREGYHCDNRGRGHTGVDLDRWTWKRKRRNWQNTPTSVVAPSTWIAEEARNSVLFSECPVHVIPNAIDTDVYKPHNQQFARDVLNLPSDRPLVVFGAVDPTTDSQKGFSLLKSALQQLQKLSVRLGVFGASHGPGEEEFGCPTHYLGYLHDDETLALVYSAADVVVVPSKLESFGLTAAESLACGTPVVCFRTSGLRSVVNHKETGYLADPFCPKDLTHGIKFLLKKADYKLISRQARMKAVNNFSYGEVAKRHFEVYNYLI